jgi:hypothetical protein
MKNTRLTLPNEGFYDPKLKCTITFNEAIPVKKDEYFRMPDGALINRVQADAIASEMREKYGL